MGRDDLTVMKQAYRAWKLAHENGRVAAPIAGMPGTAHELLYALEVRDSQGICALASVVANRLATVLWQDTPLDFCAAVTAHTKTLCLATRETSLIELVWRTVGGALAEPVQYRDVILDELLANVEDVLPEDGRNGMPFRVFVRDFILEIVLTRGVCHELENRSFSTAALTFFRKYMRPKIMPRIRQHGIRQDEEDVCAEIEEGLLGFGAATASWGHRNTSEDFDRSQSSLAAFVTTMAGFAAKSAGRKPVLFRIDAAVLKALEVEGLPDDLLTHLGALEGQTWRTWQGCTSALKKKVVGIHAPENERWLRFLRLQTAVYEIHEGGPGPDGKVADKSSKQVIAPRGVALDGDIETLVEVVADQGHFAAFLHEWEELEVAERVQLRQKFTLLKIIVLQECIDEWHGASPTRPGHLQLKFVILQGVSRLVVGVADGVTTHLRASDFAGEAVPRNTVTAAGFVRYAPVESDGQDHRDAWDLLRVLYTISFVSALRYDEASNPTSPGSASPLPDGPDGGCRIPIAWLSDHVLARGSSERTLDEDRIRELLKRYATILDAFVVSAGSVMSSSDHGKDVLEIQVEPDVVVVSARYPHVILANYAPNAFATMYWNVQQGKKLSIADMRSKLRDLRVSLHSLRRLCDGMSAK